MCVFNFFLFFFLSAILTILICIFVLLYKFYRYFEANGWRWRSDINHNLYYISKAIKDFHNDCKFDGFETKIIFEEKEDE